MLPKLVTLSDIERRNGRYFALFYQIRLFLEQNTSKQAKLDPYCLRQKCSLKNVMFKKDSVLYCCRGGRCMGSSSDSLTICREQSGIDIEEQMGCLLSLQLPDILLVTLLLTRPLAVVPPSERRRCFLSDVTGIM